MMVGYNARDDGGRSRTTWRAGPFFHPWGDTHGLSMDGLHAVTERHGGTCMLDVVQWCDGLRPTLPEFIGRYYGEGWSERSRRCAWTDACYVRGTDYECDGSCEHGEIAHAMARERERRFYANGVHDHYLEWCSEERVAGRRPGITAKELHWRIAQARAFVDGQRSTRP